MAKDPTQSGKDPADKSPSSGQPKAGAPGEPKKPVAILDLKASEVKVPAGAAADANKPAGAEPGKPSAGASVAAAAVAAKSSGNGGNPGSSKPAEPGKSAPSASATPPKSASGARPSAKRGGLFSHLLTGAITLAVGLFALDRLGIANLGFDQLGLPTVPPQTVSLPEDVKARIAALETKASAAAGRIEPAVAEQLKAAEARISELKSQIAGMMAGQAKLASAHQEPQKPDSETAIRLQRLEENLKALAQAAGTDAGRGRVPELAALTSRMSELEAALASQIADIRRGLAKDVDTKTAASSASAEAARTGAERLDREAQAIKADAARLSQRVEDLKAQADRIAASVKVLSEDMAGAKSGIAEVKAALDRAARPQDVASALAPLAQKVGALETSVAGVVKSEAERSSNAGRILLSLELQNLKRAIDRGGKFATELAAVEKAGTGSIDLTPLVAFKDKGAPTLADLSRDFRPLANKVLDAEAEGPNATFWQRFVTGAKSVVRIRKAVYADSDTSTEATLGRMETAVAAGRLSDALAFAKNLKPDAMKVPGLRDWLDRVETRANIDETIAHIEAELKTSLAAPSPKP